MDSWRVWLLIREREKAFIALAGATVSHCHHFGARRQTGWWVLVCHRAIGRRQSGARLPGKEKVKRGFLDPRYFL
jgi:hypothetical protein